MADECVGNWNTTAHLDESPGGNPHLEGVVRITRQDGTNVSGFFDPRAGGSEPLAGGKCRPLNRARTLFSLSFQVRITAGDLFGFRGLINTTANPNLIVCGMFIVLESDFPEGGDTGTWEGSRGGGPPVRGSKGRKGGSKAKKSAKKS